MEKKGMLISGILIILLSLQFRLSFGQNSDATIIIICAALSPYAICICCLCCFPCVHLICLALPEEKPKPDIPDLNGPVDLALPPNSTLPQAINTPTVPDTETRTTTLPSYSEALNWTKYPQVVNV